MHLSRIYFVCALLFATSIVLAQDPLRLQNEVNKLVLSDSAVNNKKLILFTGSSSIRFWGDIKAYYPEYNAVNRGFGSINLFFRIIQNRSISTKVTMILPEEKALNKFLPIQTVY
jgi:hypothetical protein